MAGEQVGFNEAYARWRLIKRRDDVNDPHFPAMAEWNPVHV
jgi:hypothetical protein